MESGAYRVRDVWSIPGWLSLSRVALAIMFPYAIEHRGWALTIIVSAALSDYLDGYVARRLHQVSPTGAALDPITDKIFALSVVVTLITTGRLSVLQALLLNARELLELPLALFLVAAPKARVVRAARLGSNLLGKLTTGLQFVALLAVLCEHPSHGVLIAATAALGAVSAGAYAWRFIAALRAPSTAAT